METTWHAREGPRRLAFGRFVVDVERAQVRRDDQLVALRPKTFALLMHLADRSGAVVDKRELMDAVWSGLVVTDDSLTQAISELRGALDDRDQKLIKTIPKRGYLFDIAVRPAPEPPIDTAGVGSTAAAHQSRQRIWLAALTVVLLVGAVGIARMGSDRDVPIGSTLTEHRSVAVMPFDDLSEPPAPHLAQAVDTGLSTDLARFADTLVTPRATAAALGTSASVDPKRVARDLGVRHVVTGTVRRDGERLQVTAQLVRTEDGALLWADRFTYSSAADWLEQRDISARIANLLDLRMRHAVLQQARNSPPSSQAVDHWMRGAYILSRLRTKAELLQAREHFQTALALQPDSAHALAGLAMTHVEAVLYRWTHQRQLELSTGERLARQALAIDPQNQDAMVALAGALMFNGRIEEAMAVTHQHLSMNPNDARANRDLAAQYYFAGRWEDSLQQVDIAIRLNPLDRLNLSLCQTMAATALLSLRRYDEAINRARLILDGPRAGGHGIIASAEAWRGNLDAARAQVAVIMERAPELSIEGLRGQRGSKEPAYLAGMDHFFEGLRRAGVPERTPQAR